MDTFFALLLVAITAVGVWLYNKGSDLLDNLVNATIRRGSRDRVDAATGTKKVFTTSASLGDIIAVLRTKVEFVETVPALTMFPKFTITLVDEGALIACGGKLADQFRAELTCEEQGGTRKVTYRVVHWLNQNGLPMALRQMEEMDKAVTAAVTQVDPSATIDVTLDE